MKESYKALTIHLYRVEEVIASLRWSLLSRNYTEAIFWTVELYDSNYIVELLDCAMRVFVLYIGIRTHPSLFQSLQTMRASDEIERDALVLMMYNLCRIKGRDATAMHLIMMEHTEPRWKPKFSHKRVYTTLEESIQDCLKRGKIKEAWLLGQHSSDLWSCINSHDVRNYKFLTEKEAQAVCVSLCSKVPIIEETCIYSSLLEEIEKALHEWDSEPSMRKRRIFKIRPEAIVYICNRSYTGESSETDIQMNLEQTLFESPYWRSILEAYGSIDDTCMKWNTEYAKEQFYDTYFPDDIPDEWSSADREKSHGISLQFKESIATIKYYNNILLKTTSTLWFSSKKLTSLSEKNIPCDFPLKRMRKNFIIKQ
jgi:hypothetical protein